MKYIEIHGQTVAMAEFLPAQASSNPPWILIHGAGHDHGVWTELAQGLSAAGDHLIAPATVPPKLPSPPTITVSSASRLITSPIRANRAR